MTRGARRELVREVKLSTGDVGVLLCADGMVVMVESEEGLQSSLQALSEAMGRWDLKVNGKKTKVMKSKGCHTFFKHEEHNTPFHKHTHTLPPS